jgi:hypothetical protein
MLQPNVFTELDSGIFAVRFDAKILEFLATSANSVVLNFVGNTIVASVYGDDVGSEEISDFLSDMSVGSPVNQMERTNQSYGHSRAVELERSIFRNEGSSSDVAMRSVGSSSVSPSVTRSKPPKNSQKGKRSLPATVAEYRELYPDVTFSSCKSLRPEDCKITDPEIFNYKVVSIFSHYHGRDENVEQKFYSKAISSHSLKVAGCVNLAQWWKSSTNLQKIMLLTFPKDSSGLMTAITAQEMQWSESVSKTDRAVLQTLMSGCRFPDSRTYA